MRPRTGPLVGLTEANAANHEAEIKPRINESGGELIEQLWITGRIVVVKIIDGIDYPNAEKLTPQAIHGRTREIGIFG
ncbi:hypothetical protein D3C84_1213230 [compost metagenome]